ncbi:SDR family NAD(P)-dependent oxidoreductase [Patescibacteria group bacterium]
MFSLQGKKALVTGGSRGIGRGIALALARQGAEVAVNYYSKKKEAEKTVRLIKDQDSQAFSFQADVGQLEEIKKMFVEVKKRWGKLDILINNAGILQFKPFEKIVLEDWERMLSVNLRGQFFCAQQAVRLMAGWGRIVNIASISSGGMGVAYPQISHYTTSKGGVVGMTEALAVELGPKGINVNAIAPGAIDTDMGGGDEKTNQALAARLPKKRVGKPEDIGAAAVFLASEEADYITGTVLYVDGGWLASG